MRPLHIPSCRDRGPLSLLSARQRREVVRLLAQEGPDALDGWIEQELGRDPRIRERIQAERARLEREARRERRRIQSEYDERREGTESAWERQMRRLSSREEGLRDRLDELSGTQGPSLDEMVDRTSLLKAAVRDRQREKSLWERVTGGLYRAWLWLVSLWVRFVRWIRGKPGPGQSDATLTLPDGASLDLPSLLASSPGLRVEVRRRLSEGASVRERLRHLWRRLTGREDYARIARELMAEEMESAAAQIQVERRTKAQEVREQLEELDQALAETRRERRSDLEELEAKRHRELEEVERRLAEEPMRDVREEVLEELYEAGLVGEEGSPTEALMERFAGLLYEDVRRALPQGGRTTPGAFLGGEGEYERGPMRSLNERGHMDLVSSLVEARTHHPHVRHIYDDDIMVHREVRTTSTHVVLIFDRSGSMEEKGRFEAAKRVCLVMYRTVKDQDPDNRVDILSMSTEVERVSLAEAWGAELGGFTNYQASLERARRLLEDVDADRRLVYLITDGLPEAYVNERGENVVDQPEVCMPHAKEAASRLGDLPGTRLLILQLETEDPMFLDAAREVAEAAGGEVEGIDPESLIERLVLDFEARAPAAPGP